MESVEEYREIEFEGVKLRVYKNGDIFRWYWIRGRMKIQNPYWKKSNIITSNTGYYTIKLNKRYNIHRIIAMVYLGLDITNTKNQVDHIDRCRTNNNINNLRIVNNQQNQWNNNAKGYSLNKRVNKWQTYIYLNSKQINLGYFNTEQEASNAYQNAKKIYHVI